MADEEEARGPPPPPMQRQHSHPAEDPPKMDDKHHLHKEPPPPPPYNPRGGYPPRDHRRGLCTFLVILLLLLGITALTLWLVYRPHHPKFRVISAAVYQLNTSSPPFISATMQFTVVTRNPNKRVTIHYNPFSAYVSYKSVAITPPAVLPSLLQDAKSTVALSPVLGGTPVPVVSELGSALAMDEAYGVVALRLVFTGKVKYKAGAVKSGRNGIYVGCDMLISLKTGLVGNLPLLQSPPCKVYV